MKWAINASIRRLGGAACALAAAVALTGLAVGPASALTIYNLKNLENGDCLNGALVTSHAEVTLTPCSTSDNHMLWQETTYTISGGKENGLNGFQFMDIANHECLNGTTSLIYLTPCSSTDNHMLWVPFPVSSGTYMFKNAYNYDCLNGTLAKVYPNPGCNESDNHYVWEPGDF